MSQPNPSNNTVEEVEPSSSTNVPESSSGQRSEKLTILESAQERIPWKSHQEAFHREHEVIEKYWEEMQERKERLEREEKMSLARKEKGKHRVLFSVFFLILAILAVRYMTI